MSGRGSPYRWVPTFLVKSEGLSQAGAGFVTALITGGTIVSWPLAGFLSDHFGRRKPIFLVSQATSVLVWCRAPGSRARPQSRR